MKQKIDNLGGGNETPVYSWEKLRNTKVKEIMKIIENNNFILIFYTSENKILKLSSIDLRRLAE